MRKEEFVSTSILVYQILTLLLFLHKHQYTSVTYHQPSLELKVTKSSFFPSSTSQYGYGGVTSQVSAL